MSHFFSKTKNRRRRVLSALERYLEHHGWPRFQMTLIVALTGLVWFLSGYLMLRAGLRVIFARYIAAWACSYVAFVLLVWIWLWRERRCLMRPAEGAPPKLDATEKPAAPARDVAVEDVAGVALDAVDAASTVGDVIVHTAASSSSSAEGAGSAGGLAAGADCEGCLVVVVGGVVLGAFIAAGYIVYIAPTLLAEIMLDGALSAGLRARIGRIEEHHWLESAIAQTWFPFLVIGLILLVGGGIIQSYAPDAATLGEVLQHVRSVRGY